MLPTSTTVSHRPPGITAAEQIRVSVILPVTDETTSLRKTVQILLDENRASLHEIIIVTCGFTTPGAHAVCAGLRDAYPELISVREQVRPRLGGAMRDAFEWASGSHVLMMASDLETDPASVREMIAAAGTGADIVTATRWTTSGAFEGYNPVKFALNWVFQRFFAIAYGTQLSDLTFGFRLFRAEWVKTIAWEEFGHPFLLETLLKPLRLGATVVEVPTRWRARIEGVSHNTFWRNFHYLGTALRVRMTSPRKLLVQA